MSFNFNELIGQIANRLKIGIPGKNPKYLLEEYEFSPDSMTVLWFLTEYAIKHDIDYGGARPTMADAYENGNHTKVFFNKRSTNEEITFLVYRNYVTIKQKVSHRLFFSGTFWENNIPHESYEVFEQFLTSLLNLKNYHPYAEKEPPRTLEYVSIKDRITNAIANCKSNLARTMLYEMVADKLSSQAGYNSELTKVVGQDLITLLNLKYYANITRSAHGLRVFFAWDEYEKVCIRLDLFSKKPRIIALNKNDLKLEHVILANSFYSLTADEFVKDDFRTVKNQLKEIYKNPFIFDVKITDCKVDNRPAEEIEARQSGYYITIRSKPKESAFINVADFHFDKNKQLFRVNLSCEHVDNELIGFDDIGFVKSDEILNCGLNGLIADVKDHLRFSKELIDRTEED